MLTAVRWSIILVAAHAGMAGVAAAATQEQIGTWVISCPGETSKSSGCLMRSSRRFLDKASVTWVISCPGETSKSSGCLMRSSRRFLDKASVIGDLEVQAQGRILVPVIAFRGVSAEALMTASLIGKIEASIRLQGGAPEELHCAASAADHASAMEYICGPSEADRAKVAEGLPAARAAIVRVAIVINATKPLAALEKSLELSGTNEALERLRALGPTQLPGPMPALAARSPSALLGMADRALKAAGYPNGVAQLQSLLAKYAK